MKRYIACILLLEFIMIGPIHPKSKTWEIATWQDFKTAAVSYTFDDLTSGHLAVAVPMFNDLGFQLTLFPVSDWVSDWQSLALAAAQGHEIASHTVTHPHLSALTREEQTVELTESQKKISKITGHSCHTIAYPYCDPGDAEIASKFFIAGRICSGKIESATPADMMQLSSIMVGSLSSVKTTDDFDRLARETKIRGGWCVYLVHGIDDDGGYSPISSDTLKASLVYLTKYPEDYWVSTFGNVAKYILERNSAQVFELSKNRNEIKLKLTDSLDNAIYNVPLTIRRKLPGSWKAASVRQNGKEIHCRIITENSARYLTFNLIPDNGLITVTKIKQ